MFSSCFVFLTLERNRLVGEDDATNDGLRLAAAAAVAAAAAAAGAARRRPGRRDADARLRNGLLLAAGHRQGRRPRFLSLPPPTFQISGHLVVDFVWFSFGVRDWPIG